MRPERGSVRSAVTLVGLIALAGVLVSSSTRTTGASERGTAFATGAPAASGSGLEVTVTWDGTPISVASTVVNAFPLASGSVATVEFVYRDAASDAVPANASLLLRFFGLTLSTEGTVPSASGGAGTAELNWSIGSLNGVLQGVYEILAQLTDGNGSLVFSEAFYVELQAPFVIGSAIAVFGLVLAVAEAYWIVVVVRARARQRGGTGSR